MDKYREKLRRGVSFLSLLRLEPFVFLFIFSYYIKRVPLDQLIQDKICMQWYNTTATYCKHLPATKSENDILGFKSKILADATQFSMYQNLITTGPSVVWSLFVGSFFDNYIHGKKLMLIVGGFGMGLEMIITSINSIYFNLNVYYLLLAFVPNIITGGMIGTFAAIWSYAAAVTPPKMRALRISILEICLFTAIPISGTMAGKLLTLTPLFGNGQLNNYSTIFIIASSACALSVFWVLFMLNEVRDKNRFNIIFNIDNGEKKAMEIEMHIRMKDQIDSKISDYQISKNSSEFNNNKSPYVKTSKVNLLKLLFNINNVKDIFVTCVKERENYGRAQIWLIFLAIVCYLLSHFGPNVMLFQFCQKVYNWDAENYSYVSAAGTAISIICMATIVPFLVKVIKVKDTTLSMYGIVSYFIQSIIRATFLTPLGYYAALAAGGAGGVTSVGLRTHMSKIVAHEELGKVFSLMSALDATAPLIASVLFTFIFKATMDTLPGACFFVTAAILFIPLFVVIWIDLYTKVLDVNKKKSPRDYQKNYTISTKL